MHYTFCSGFYPTRSWRALITTVEPAFNEEEWQASIVSAHFHEGFFPSYSDSFFCLWWQGRGKIAVFGEFYVFANLLLSPWDRSKGFFVCSFRIVAHKKHAHCGRAILKGLYFGSTFLLLQEWCDLLLLFICSQCTELSLIVHADIHCWNSVVSIVYPMHHSGRGKISSFYMCGFLGQMTISPHH